MPFQGTAFTPKTEVERDFSEKIFRIAQWATEWKTWALSPVQLRQDLDTYTDPAQAYQVWRNLLLTNPSTTAFEIKIEPLIDPSIGLRSTRNSLTNFLLLQSGVHDPKLRDLNLLEFKPFLLAANLAALENPDGTLRHEKPLPDKYAAYECLSQFTGDHWGTLDTVSPVAHMRRAWVGGLITLTQKLAIADYDADKAKDAWFMKTERQANAGRLRQMGVWEFNTSLQQIRNHGIILNNAIFSLTGDTREIQHNLPSEPHLPFHSPKYIHHMDVPAALVGQSENHQLLFPVVEDVVHAVASVSPVKTSDIDLILALKTVSAALQPTFEATRFLSQTRSSNQAPTALSPELNEALREAYFHTRGSNLGLTAGTSATPRKPRYLPTRFFDGLG